MEIQNAFKNARRKSLWKKTYASTNIEEYFAECAMTWFNANVQSSFPNGVKNQINTRTELKSYDRKIYLILSGIYPEESL